MHYRVTVWAELVRWSGLYPLLAACRDFLLCDWLCEAAFNEEKRVFEERRAVPPFFPPFLAEDVAGGRQLKAALMLVGEVAIKSHDLSQNTRCRTMAKQSNRWISRVGGFKEERLSLPPQSL